VFMKYGISQNPGTRYTKAELDGGYLVRLSTGPRAWVRQMEYQMNKMDPGPQMVRP
jgi:hypothetical protein